MKKAILTLFLILISQIIWAGVSRIEFKYDAIYFDNPLNTSFVAPGDTVLFIDYHSLNQEDTVTVKSLSLPKGVSHWQIKLSKSDSIKTLIIDKVGYYKFTYLENHINGQIICNSVTQGVRCFEFKVFSQNGFDQPFVACTSDSIQLTIADSLLHLATNKRMLHIKGNIAAGNGGFNKNWSWHFSTNQWRFAQISEEVCDGTPQFVEDNLNYWINFLGYFCPWSATIIKEVENQSTAVKEFHSHPTIFPNPSNDFLVIKTGKGYPVEKRIISLEGQELLRTQKTKISTANLLPGIYLLEIRVPKNGYEYRKLYITH